MLEKKDLRYLLKNIDDQQYFVINYSWFKDYYKIVNAVYQESVLRYNPSEETKHFIELTAFSNTIIAVVKIPIIITNINSIFISKINHNIFFSKYNNNLIALIFSENNISIRYSYTTQHKFIELNNKGYHSLSFVKNFKNKEISDDEEEYEQLEDEELYMIENNNTDINEEFNNNNKDLYFNEYIKSNLLLEETFSINNKDKIYHSINDNIIKNVICYISMEFDNLKDIFKKLGNGKININIKRNKMILNSIIPKYNKQITLQISVIHINKNTYNKDINFFINSNAITKLKSLTSNFNIISTDNKKIFKLVELKVVMNNTNNYGITIFPANFTEKNRINNNIFDIYNSILLYIPEHV